MYHFPKLCVLLLGSALAWGQATVSPTSLPVGEVGFPYSTPLTATGGTPPYTNWIVSNGTLPQGLTLNNLTGVISGTALSVFTSNFSVTVRDSTATTSAPQNFTISVGPAVKITGPSSLPQGVAGVGYPPPGGGVTFSATGGWAPLAWSATGLPPGMSISAAGGLLSGTPPAGNYSPTFTVTDSLGASASVTLPLTVTTLPSLQITKAPSLAPGIAGTFYSQLLTATGGTQPYNWTLVSGTLPLGFSLASVGVVSGTANAPGVFTFTAKVTDAAGASQTQLFSVSISWAFIGSMPHLAAEGVWSTTFTIVNKGPAAAQAQVSVFDDGGNPLPLPLSFPQVFPPPPVAFNPQPSATAGLPPNASWLVAASGPTGVPFVLGSAELSGLGTLDGFAIFHYDPTAQEAVVPMETRNAASYTLAYDNTNGVLTGIALENASNAPANIPVILRSDGGSQTLITSISLPAYGHTSFVLSTQYPLLTTNNRGTLEFDTPGFGTSSAQQISVLGIRYTGGTLTTIPVLANVGTNGGLMAHLASGAGWQTTFALVNTGTMTASATVSFLDDSGSPQPVSLTILNSANAGPLQGFQTEYTQTIAPGASLWLQTAAPGVTQALTGSAQLITNGNVSGYAIFRYNPNGQEAVVPLESRSAAAFLLAFDNTNSIVTGVAVSSGVALPLAIPVVIRDDTGAQIGTTTVQLNAEGHTSFLLSQQYPQTAKIRGTVEFDVPAGAPISVLGIRSPPSLTFTTLPALAK